MERLNKERFKKNPALFLEHAVKEYVRTSPDNRLTSFNDEPIFNEPLVGIADGDDPIFQEYKTLIGGFHFTPREVLAMDRQKRGGDTGREPDNVSAISFIMPATYETRLSLRNESRVPSLRWNHTRWQGQDLINELSKYVVSLLGEMGYRALAPELADFYKIFFSEAGIRVSNWSQRHIAYAAGLGTFSLNDGFITPRGIAIRCGSVVTDIALMPTPRVYANHLDNCLFYRDRSCRRCIERCPVGAISEQGHDKKKCRDFLMKGQGVILEELGRGEGYIGTYLGCGLCQTDVPCEFSIPPSSSK